MRVNKEQLEALAALPDDMLWSEIVRVAATYGFTLPKTTPQHGELERLRETVRGDKLNVSDALKLINSYRRGAK
jgi:hypothetical protein